MDTLPPDTILSIFQQLDNWESLPAVALLNRTTYALYVRYKTSITAQILENIRCVYLNFHARF